ncbi:helix-turn-helix transcriptional regulator [Paraflavisolibacter caeni]|uniref:helix-turn-helix transcriptional regulator n=1 Tax=Paraflavisolibacter caeni TaxID=2982496 RepID=UPI003C6E8D19
MDFTKKVLTLSEACAYTRFVKSYMYKRTMAGTIPCSKPNGKAIFFDREELER